MGMQVSFGLDSKIPEKGNLWPVEKISWGNFEGIGIIKRIENNRRASYG